MDVSKIFHKSSEQGETVATKQTGPIKKQRKPEPVAKVEEIDDDWIMTEEYINPEDVQKMKELLSLEAKDGFSLEETEVLERPIQAIVSTTSPLAPNRHPLSARFHMLLKEIGDLHDKKQKDYGTAEDPFANVRGATEFGLPAPMGAFIAMSDIMSRIKSFCVNGRLENEPLDNALRDMAVYSLIALILYEEENASND